MNKLLRILKHRWLDARDAYRLLGPESLARLEARVHASETAHSGEIRLCVEAGLPLPALWRGLSARDRAVELFGALGVWDTEANNGVLIYLLLADRDVEIVADRGVHAKLGKAVWDEVCREMEGAFRDGRFEQGVLAGIRSVGLRLARHYPHAGVKLNELPDRPVLI